MSSDAPGVAAVLSGNYAQYMGLILSILLMLVSVHASDAGDPATKKHLDEMKKHFDEMFDSPEAQEMLRQLRSCVETKKEKPDLVASIERKAKQKLARSSARPNIESIRQEFYAQLNQFASRDGKPVVHPCSSVLVPAPKAPEGGNVSR